MRELQIKNELRRLKQVYTNLVTDGNFPQIEQLYLRKIEELMRQLAPPEIDDEDDE